MSKFHKISEYCEVYDGPHATPKESDKGPVYLGIKAITEQGRIDSSQFKYLSDEDYVKWTKRVTPEANDIVFSYEATLGRYAIIPEGFHGCLGRRLAIVRVKDTNKLNYKYLYYYFLSPAWKAFISNHTVSGSTVDRISIDEFPNYEIQVPEIEMQNKIVNILDSIDTRIDINIKTINVLESMAKTLYDYWFVQFDFPDANGHPYKTSGGKMEWNETLSREIPAGWKVRRIKDVLSVVTGKEDANFATMNGKFKFFTCSEDVLKCDIAAFDGKAVLLAGNGNFNVKHYTGKFNAYQRTYVLIPNDNNLYGVLYLSVLRMVDTLTKHSTGSIVKFITKGDVEDIKILEQPNKELYSKINVLMDKIEKLQEENERLTGIRDFLLPMLMNGQVTFCQ